MALTNDESEIQGCHRSGKSQEKLNFSGQEKTTLVRKDRENHQKSGKSQEKTQSFPQKLKVFAILGTFICKNFLA